MKRKATKKINVGGVIIGGGSEISVQSMCNTDTRDIAATSRQINKLADGGCDIVRVAVVDEVAADAISEIKKRVKIPIVADIHFDWRLAVKSIASGADKIRINPGNIGSPEKIKKVADACRAAGVPIRIGVNSGSIEPEILKKYKKVCAEALTESALNNVELLTAYGFDDICVSIKASSVPLTIEAYRLLSQKTDFPLHLGVTEAGTPELGMIKSAIGIGALLCDGIGDTIRVSLTADPIHEVRAARNILKAVGLSKTGAELISCPTCGRCEINLEEIAVRVEEKLKSIKVPLKVAVMGCVVNGPGEAREADVGLAGGKDSGVLFYQGKVFRKVPMESIVDELMRLIDIISESKENEIVGE